MKIINVEIEDGRWAKLKAIADRERRHIKHQAALVLENWIDGETSAPPAPSARVRVMDGIERGAFDAATVQE